MLLLKIEEIAKNKPVIVTGDFNCTESSKSYKILVKEGGLKDTRYFAKEGTFGPIGTVTDFKSSISPRRVDYIFVKNDVKIIRHFVISNRWRDRFPSDHLPIMADIRL